MDESPLTDTVAGMGYTRIRWDGGDSEVVEEFVEGVLVCFPEAVEGRSRKVVESMVSNAQNEKDSGLVEREVHKKINDKYVDWHFIYKEILEVVGTKALQIW